MTEFRLGDTVSFNKTLVRDRGSGVLVPHPATDAAYRELSLRLCSASRNYWGETSVTDMVGIIVGKRTLSDGVVSYSRYSGESFYVPVRYFSAWMISFDLRRKPVLVLSPQRIS